MLRTMSWMIERRLRNVGARLARARADLDIAQEHLVHFAEESDDASIRALVSEGGDAGIEATQAQRHTAAMTRHRDELVQTIARLEAAQDELLDRLNERRSS